jgi:cytoskeletal protein CcmA (bactofilin family)
MSEFRPEKKNVVYIGEGVTLSGAIHAQDVVVVDGAVDGEITCNSLIVGETGVVNGVISVSDADIYGKIGSDISVKQLMVRASGRVEGKWNYGEIEVEKGGVLAGMAESTEFRSERKSAAKEEAGAHRQQFKKPELILDEGSKLDSVANVTRVPSIATRALRDRKRLA